MCCRACHGYEMCQAKNELRDDCCPQCKYFADCMENSSAEEAAPRVNQPARKYYKGKR